MTSVLAARTQETEGTFAASRRTRRNGLPPFTLARALGPTMKPSFATRRDRVDERASRYMLDDRVVYEVEAIFSAVAAGQRIGMRAARAAHDLEVSVEGQIEHDVARRA